MSDKFQNKNSFEKLSLLSSEGKERGTMEMHEKSLIVGIHKKWALVVLILNIIIPGLGTIISGCVARGDHMFNNTIVGLLQLTLTPFFLLGWFWSISLGL